MCVLQMTPKTAAAVAVVFLLAHVRVSNKNRTGSTRHLFPVTVSKGALSTRQRRAGASGLKPLFNPRNILINLRGFWVMSAKPVPVLVPVSYVWLENCLSGTHISHAFVVGY